MNKLKNIVIINDFDYTQGGASKVAIDTANKLCCDYKVYFFSGDTKETSSLNKKIIRICTNQGESLKSKNKFVGAINGIYNFKAKKCLKKLLEKLNKEETIIHIHGWTKCLSSSVFDICWKMGFKVVLTLHDYFTACPNGGYFNYKENKICNFKPLSLRCITCNCDSRNYAFKLYRVIRQFVQNKVVKLNDRLTDVISISSFSEKILKQTLNRDVNIHRVYNPIDLDKKMINIDYRKNNYYLYVGRISKEKGVETFCKTITNLKLKGIVVGDGDERLKLQSKYQNVEFVGWKKSDDVKKYMKKAKALIFPSLWYEGAPLTPLEAMQYGVPLISSDCNAAIDYINKNNGFIFKNDEELVEILKKLEKNQLDPKKIKIPDEYLTDYLCCIIKAYNEVLYDCK